MKMARIFQILFLGFLIFLTPVPVFAEENVSWRNDIHTDQSTSIYHSGNTYTETTRYHQSSNWTSQASDPGEHNSGSSSNCQ
ncbi:hypothetical protein [Kyrpidia spormannii]|uniref:hypothetical protein n=1 Tax=Kyrpidia spormannii TaxID=2055160 RepID=UPI001054719A|nr:hypothetical protein [Kyrpidia spormannii]